MTPIQAYLPMLKKVWWSPYPGTEYLADSVNHIGAFNVYWLLSHLPRKGEPGHQACLGTTLGTYTWLKKILQLELPWPAEGKPYPLHEWAVVFNPQKFTMLLAYNQNAHPDVARLHKLMQRSLQHRRN